MGHPEASMTRGKYKRKREQEHLQREKPSQALHAKDEVMTTNQQLKPTKKLGREPIKKNSLERNWLTTKLRRPVWFIVGILFGLFIVQWFVELLPGSHISASLSGMHVESGNAAGCNLYTFTVNTDDPIEYVYAKLQFPSQINNFKVGFPLVLQL